MIRQFFARTVLFPLLLLLFASPSHAGDVYWRLDPGVESCSMNIDPSLTQGQWATFTRQAGAMLSFKSLAPAEALGKKNFEIGIDYSRTPIDQHAPAWINTFVHPDADCPLGDEINIPTIRARLGVTQSIDVGGYWTTAPGANYGFVGGEVKYAFLRETPRRPAAALSTSFNWLTGVPDFNVSVYSLGLAASKRVAGFTPYAGVRENVSIGTETTSKVDLDTETIFFTQGFIGATYSIWKFGVAAEYNIADVNTFALMFGFQSR